LSLLARKVPWVQQALQGLAAVAAAVVVMEQPAQLEYKVQQELLEPQAQLARLVRVLQEPPA